MYNDGLVIIEIYNAYTNEFTMVLKWLKFKQYQLVLIG